MVSDMSNLYVINNDDPIQSVDEVGPIVDGYNLTGIDEPLSLDLDDSEGKKRVEHRHSKRFQLKEDAFALIRSFTAGPLNIQGKSMGCIACTVFNAKPAKLGIIENISMGGLMFQHVASKTQINKTVVLDIILAGSGFYMADMPFKIIADSAIPEDIPGDSIDMRQVRLQFKKLNANQQARLNEFIFIHGTEIGEIGLKE